MVLAGNRSEDNGYRKRSIRKVELGEKTLQYSKSGRGSEKENTIKGEEELQESERAVSRENGSLRRTARGTREGAKRFEFESRGRGGNAFKIRPRLRDLTRKPS